MARSPNSNNDEGRPCMLLPRVVLTALALLGPNSVALCSQSDGAETRAALADGESMDWVNQKTPVIHMFLGPSPTEYMKAISENKDVLRSRILLDSSTIVEFHERPRGIDFYDSTIVVSRREAASRTYNVGSLIGHQALSLAHVAIVPSGNGAGMLVCEYVGGAVGAREGFAILRFSPAGLDLHTLPLTDFGKVVVFKRRPERAEIWSALPYGAGADADPMYYSTRSCRWKSNGYDCGPPRRKRGRFGPAAVDDPGIEIR